MLVTPIKTHKVTVEDNDIFALLKKYLPPLKERSVVAITSKVVAICEGRVVPVEGTDKDELVRKEVEYFLPKEENKYNFFLTVKNNIMIASGGIDESNGNGYYILWPENSQESANSIREFLVQEYGVSEVGVIITDSKTTPLRRGVTGVTLAHSGFSALNNYIDEPDIFGRHLHVTKANIADGLAGSSVLAMGEGSEQTPLSVIEDVPFVEFQKRNPTEEELFDLRIPLEEDIYASILMRAPWEKGQGK